MIQKLKKKLPPEILPYELLRVLLVILFLLFSVLTVVCFIGIFVYALRTVLAYQDPETISSLLDSPSPKLRFFTDLIARNYGRWTFEGAKRMVIFNAVMTPVSVAAAIVLWDQLRRHEIRFRKEFSAKLLEKDFRELNYDPERHVSADEPLCALGLLENYQRYYTANSLRAMYRGSFVCCDDVICGGVYGRNYSGRKIRVRGRWITLHLAESLCGKPVIAETRGTKNKLSYAHFAKTGLEIDFNYSAFSDVFRVYAQSAAEAQKAISKPVADRLLSLWERYPDFCVIFLKDKLYILLRRKSFHRRIDIFAPYVYATLEKELDLLFSPLKTFADVLLFDGKTE